LLSNPDAKICANASELASMWCLASGQALRQRAWQGEYVLYNDLSGDTHLLGESAIELLMTLQAAPASQEALAASLGAGPEHGEADAAAVAALLDQLRALALIELVA
jgi:PqqD family protein of HPr-rel-A system